MTQCQKIVKIMLKNKNRVFSAKDFQGFGKWFIGYEASARISDLIRLYPASFIVGKDGRFRTIQINLENKNGIKELEQYIGGEE